jgi:predicted transcriptional regulator
MNIPNIDDAIRSYAKAKRIKPEEFDTFKATVLNGMRVLGLNTDHIEVDKFNIIAKKQMVDPTIGEKWDMIEAAGGK